MFLPLWNLEMELLENQRGDFQAMGREMALSRAEQSDRQLQLKKKGIIIYI